MEDIKFNHTLPIQLPWRKCIYILLPASRYLWHVAQDENSSCLFGSRRSVRQCGRSRKSGQGSWLRCGLRRCRLSASLHAGIKGVLKWAKTWHADAIIGRFDNDDNVEIFRENGIIAIAQDYKARFSNIPNITVDYYKTGRMAAEFFLRKGYQNFAFYGYRDTVWSQERCEGFYKCIAEHGFGNCFQSYQEQSLDDLWFYEAPPLLKWLLLRKVIMHCIYCILKIIWGRNWRSDF